MSLPPFYPETIVASPPVKSFFPGCRTRCKKDRASDRIYCTRLVRKTTLFIRTSSGVIDGFRGSLCGPNLTQATVTDRPNDPFLGSEQGKPTLPPVPITPSSSQTSGHPTRGLPSEGYRLVFLWENLDSGTTKCVTGSGHTSTKNGS